MPPCNAEVKKMVNQAVHEVMLTCHQTKNEVLFDYLLDTCNQHNRIVPGEMVPLLLDKAAGNKKKAPLLLNICGETGKWLCSLNEKWTPLLTKEAGEDVWETGTLDQRKIFLKNLRKTNPAEAIVLLNAVIKSEPAEVRAGFIEILEEDLSLQDEDFLVSMLTDKSQKVKQTVYFLLKKLVGSQINRLYLGYVLKAMRIQEERYMLVAKKKVMVITEGVEPDQEVFLTGMEKISQEKGMNDQVFWLAQALEFTHPPTLARELNMDEMDLLKLITQHAAHAVLMPYLVRAAIHFKHGPWAEKLLEMEGIHHLELFEVLPPAVQPVFYKKLLDHNPADLVKFICNGSYTPIAHQLAVDVMTRLKTVPYAITQFQYQQLALYFPPSMVPNLQGIMKEIGDQNGYHFMKQQCTDMIQIIELKHNLIFN
jgi:hypothetical protein